MKNKLRKIFMLLIITIFSFNNSVFAVDDTLECSDFGKVSESLNNLFDFIKILVPLAIIGLSAYDIIKALTNKDAKEMKKAYKRLIKRLVAGVIIFFLPAIIKLILKLAETNSDLCV